MNESPYRKYQPFIEDNFRIVNIEGERVDFKLNAIQERFHRESTGRDVILKARRQGFSSDILAVFATDFILKPDTLSVVVADDANNALGLLDKVKMYLQEYEAINHVKIPLDYNSRYEMVNSYNKSRYSIGTAQNAEFGRSKTITNLHLSEAAFYRYLRKMLAGAGSAVIPTGKFVIETTANGFNEFKQFWDESVLGATGFNPLFFRASDYHPQEYLVNERKRLGERMFKQEYPESPEEAFITSGDTYIENLALARLLNDVTAWERRSGVRAF